MTHIGLRYMFIELAAKLALVCTIYICLQPHVVYRLVLFLVSFGHCLSVIPSV